MRNIETRLEEWRRAERSRDMLPAASREWQAADEEVRRARAAYHATGAQAAAYHAERAFAAEPSWWARLEAASAWWSRGTGASSARGLAVEERESRLRT